MKFKGFNQTDRRILGFAALVLLFSSLLLWQNDWIYELVQPKVEHQDPIGEVIKIENDVRRRYEVALSWIPLRNKNEVFQGDSIFTGADSTTIIKTKTGEEIEIAPNSMIVISEGRDSISVDIGFGSIQGKIKGKKLVVSSNNKITEVNSASATVKVDAGEGNSLLLNVVAGEAKVKSNRSEKILHADDAAVLTQTNKIIEPVVTTIQLQSPATDQYFKVADGQPIVMRWSSNRKSGRTKIKISTEREMVRPLIDTLVDESNYSAYNLPKDTPLYWQVMTEGGLSSVQMFAVVGDRPPIPVTPRTGQQMFYDPDLPPSQLGSRVDLSWEKGSLATEFEVQIANNKSLAKNLHVFHTKKNEYSAGLLPEGKYFWRVRSANFRNERWSEISQFSIGPEPSKQLAPPVPISAENIFLIHASANQLNSASLHALSKKATQKLIADFPVLRWTKVVGADKYELQLSKSRTFTDILHRELSVKNEYKWKSIEPGIYYWRVKALGEKFSDGLYTNAQKLAISVQAPNILTKDLLVDEVPEPILLKSMPPPLHLLWQPVLFADRYELQFSLEPEFKNSQVLLSEGTENFVTIQQPGVFYWKIRALDKHSLPISPYTEAHRLEFQRIYKSPNESSHLLTLFPKQQDTIVLVGNEKYDIGFKWNKPFKGMKYRLELSYEPEFENVFFSTLTENNFYTYPKKFDGRVVYWRLRGEKAGTTTDWTAASRFLVTYEKTPFNFEQSDQMFIARQRAKERQQELIAAYRRRLEVLRSPASMVSVVLETPQIENPTSLFMLESNLPANITDKQLARQSTFKFYSQVKNYFTFRWLKVPAAERYFIQIARDKQFKDMVINTPCWDAYYTWETIHPGKYYYRVQAFNDRYTRSAHSAVQEMTVLVAPPNPTSADQFVTTYSEPRNMWPPPDPVKVSWRPVVFARKYEIELSKNKDFALSKVYTTESTEKEIQIYGAGLYYWRVRPLNENGLVVGAFSQPRSLEVIQTDRRPAALGQLAGIFPVDRSLIFVGQGAMHVPFHWTSPAANESHTLEVSQSPQFTTLLSKNIVKFGKALLSHDLPDGPIYWRIKTAEQTSPVYQFVLRREAYGYTKEKANGPTVQKF